MANISPFQYDLYRLAVGILYINLGRAGVEFPTTTRAHPSYRVHVTVVPPVGGMPNHHRMLFPFEVRWDLWRNVVAPLFEDGSLLVKVLEGTHESLRTQMNLALLCNTPEELLTKVSKGLLVQLEAQCYTPSTSYVTEAVGALNYLTDIEITAQAAADATAQQEQTLWEDSINNGVPTNPWLLKLNAEIPTPDPPTATTEYPTAANQVPVVSNPPSSGEPIVPTGTGTGTGTIPLVYTKFD